MAVATREISDMAKVLQLCLMGIGIKEVTCGICETVRGCMYLSPVRAMRGPGDAG